MAKANEFDVVVSKDTQPKPEKEIGCQQPVDKGVDTGLVTFADKFLQLSSDPNDPVSLGDLLVTPREVMRLIGVFRQRASELGHLYTPRVSSLDSDSPSPIEMPLPVYLTREFSAHKWKESYPEDALPYLAFLLHCHFNLESTVSIRRFTAAMVQFQRMYRDESRPAYHNSTHATDATQMVGVMLHRLRQTECGRSLAPPTAVCVMLLAAAAHDVEHCGVSADLLTTIRHPLYHMFGSESTLEHYHSLLGLFTLRYYSVFDMMSPSERKASTSLFSSIILATDPK
ncbi:hypothetical protein KIPB_005778, partial [Kipferlia bialata]|eukprot:g5778.t1